MALGKGLSALILEKKEQGQDDSGVLQVATALIKDNRLQPRQTYDVVKIGELAESIKEKGMIQPVMVRKTSDGFEVIAGERRLKAARKLGLEKIPVIVRDVDDKEALVLALVENIQREELNAIEEGESFSRLIEEFKLSQEDVARMVSKDRATVANHIRLLKLPKEIKAAVIDGRISAGHARALLGIENTLAQMELFTQVLQKGLSVREAEERVKAVVSGKKLVKTGKTRLKDPEVASLEEELRRILGTKVEIVNKRGNKGKLIVEYYTLDDLDRILSVLRQ